MTGQSYYYNETMRTLNWWLNWAFDPTTGRVYDTIQAPDCEPTGLQIYTYKSVPPSQRGRITVLMCEVV